MCLIAFVKRLNLKWWIAQTCHSWARGLILAQVPCFKDFLPHPPSPFIILHSIPYFTIYFTQQHTMKHTHTPQHNTRVTPSHLPSRIASCPLFNVFDFTHLGYGSNLISIRPYRYDLRGQNHLSLSPYLDLWQDGSKIQRTSRFHRKNLQQRPRDSPHQDLAWKKQCAPLTTLLLLKLVSLKITGSDCYCNTFSILLFSWLVGLSFETMLGFTWLEFPFDFLQDIELWTRYRNPWW